MRFQSLRVKYLFVIWMLVFMAFGQNKANHLKGKGNFNPGTCTSTTEPCYLNQSNGWGAWIRDTNPLIQTPVPVLANKMLFNTVSDDYWADFLSSAKADITLYKFVSLPEAGETYEIKFDYFISSNDNSAETINANLWKHLSSDVLDRSKRINPLVINQFTNLISNVRTPVTRSITSFNTDAQYAFLNFFDKSGNQKSPKVTNIQFLQICDNDEFVITLIDGTERCGDSATLQGYKNADFFSYVSGSYTTFEFNSCNATGTTPILVKLAGTFKGCAQKNTFNADQYKITSVPISSNKFYMIPSTCNLVNGQIICTEIFVANCYVYSFDGSCKICKSGYINAIDQKGCYARIDFCSVYSLSGSCVTCISSYTLNSGVCLKCSPGFAPLNGVCAQVLNGVTLACNLTQYRNLNGVCVEGNIPNCQSYASPQGECQVCKKEFNLDIFKSCIAVCPTATDSKKYVRINNKCVLVDIRCIYANQDGYCAVCEEGFYANKGICYIIPEQTETPASQQAVAENIFIKDLSGYQYIPIADGSRIYVSGRWKNKQVYLDNNGNLYERTYLTGLAQGQEVFTDVSGSKYFIRNNQKIYFTGPNAIL